jgi:hypothetical protein
MWLILTALAAVVSTVIWYVRSPGDKYKLGLLSLMFWGATIMWLVDYITGFTTEGNTFFEISADAAMLGIAVIVLALVVWVIVLMISDPKGVFKKNLKK